VLPLLLGLSVARTAAALGVSAGWACQRRQRFITAGHHVRRTRLGPHAYFSRAGEDALLQPFVEACTPGPDRRGDRAGNGLREKYCHNRFFDSLEAVEDQLEHALRSLEHDPRRVQSITAWSWIITSLPD
jgi:hypothetical protein